jgi:hypothetical protein
VSAESLIGGGEQRDPDLGAGPYANLLGRLIASAPAVASLPTLLPSPPWTAWDHPAATTWPERDDRGTNLNLVDGAAWIDDSARRVRDLLSTYEAPLRLGHGDWESQNIRWIGDDPLAVHDWDRCHRPTGSSHRRARGRGMASRRGRHSRANAAIHRRLPDRIR